MVSYHSLDIKTPPMNNTQDIIIVGAGLSGIGTAYWLQEKCPQKSYAILEAREQLGGTWDLFRYPGVRSDSDMFTFGYRFKPWQNPKSLSEGEDILSYLEETARENDIDKHIQYQHKVLEANWSSAEKRWELKVRTPEGEKTFYASFLYMCSGYYSYEKTYRPKFEGEDNYKGQIVQPQFWPEGLDYAEQRVVVVGSGATAVTLVPNLAKKAKQVTMLQRSPTYIMKLPNRNGLYAFTRKVLPNSWAYRITRWRNLFLSMLLFGLSRTFPKRMKRLIVKGAAKQLPEGFDVEKHFTPNYKPWDQRLCVVPDGDLFTSIREGDAAVVTDKIEYFEEDGLRLKSGESIKADIVVLATGLKLKLLGGIDMRIDGETVETGNRFIYKGMMMSDVPNFAIAFGYTNNSWTLKTDLTANYTCRLLNYMDKKGYDTVVPKAPDETSEEAFLNLNSGYIQRAESILPQQGKHRPWRVYQNYLLDALMTRWGGIKDKVLKFDAESEKKA